MPDSSSSRPPSSLHGDWLRTVDALQPGDRETRAAIARLLGAPDAPATTPPTADADSAPQRPIPDAGEQQPMDLPAPTGTDASTEPFGQRIATGVSRVESPAPEAPPWLEETVPLDRPTPGGSQLPEPDSLFPEHLARSIFHRALATRLPLGPIDVAAVVGVIARGDVVRRVPRRRVRTLARGVQLLVDRGDAMLPYLRDLDRLEHTVGRVVGPPALQVLRFDASPLRGAGPGGRWTWTPYAADHLPPRGTRVLCATDLGIGVPPAGSYPASPHEWLRLHRLLRARDCSLALLVPYGPDRWPPILARRLSVVHWDPATTAVTLSARLP
jgi:hypothetical protein